MSDIEDKLAPVLAALPGLSGSELRKLGEAVEAARLAAEEASRAAFADKVRALASEAGVPLPDLLATLMPSTGAAPAKPKTKTGRASVAPKYRGPNGELWSGRGRAPTWLAAIEGTGRTRDEFLIKA
jgi:DNA-binding protein H-NS